jgi:hypothetical protein
MAKTIEKKTATVKSLSASKPERQLFPDPEELRRQRANAFFEVRAHFEETQGPLHGVREIAALQEETEEEIARLQARVKACEARRADLESEAGCYLERLSIAWRRFEDADARLVAANSSSVINDDSDIAAPWSVGGVNLDLLEYVASLKNGAELAEEYLNRIPSEAGTRPGGRTWPDGTRVSKAVGQ